MGSGSSCTEVYTIDQTTQAPPVSELRPRLKPIRAHESNFTHGSKPIKGKLHGHEDVFDLDSNVEEYDHTWGSDNKLSTIFRRSTTMMGSQNVDPPRNDGVNHDKKISTILGAARVESHIDSQSQSTLNMTSSDKIDELVTTLNSIHKQLDGKIKRRTEQVSTETESVLSHIRTETQEKEHRLLTYAKTQQAKQDENYQHLLKEYLTQLDQMKAKELDGLQRQLRAYREQIIEESQMKIMTVNEQANTIKAKVVEEEQHRSGEEIESILSQLQRISVDDKVHHLSAEIITKTNVITNANVGR